MAFDSRESEAGLARSLSLFAWWSTPTAEHATGVAEPMQQIRVLVLEAQAALQKAGAVQAQSIAELSQDLPVLLLNAAKMRDPQALLEAQIEIATRVQRCGAACALAWADFALRSKQWMPLAAAPSAEHAAAGGDRKAKTERESNHA